jgi:hypothetical protein
VLEQHHLSPEVLQRHRQRAEQVPSLPWPPGDQLGLPFEPTTLAQRLEHALGADHLLIRFRTYREYPTEEQARWRIVVVYPRTFYTDLSSLICKIHVSRHIHVSSAPNVGYDAARRHGALSCEGENI